MKCCCVAFRGTMYERYLRNAVTAAFRRLVLGADLRVEES